MDVGAGARVDVGEVAAVGAAVGGSSGVLVGAGLSAGRSVVTVVVPVSQASIDPTARRPTNPNHNTCRIGNFINLLPIEPIQTVFCSQLLGGSHPNQLSPVCNFLSGG